MSTTTTTTVATATATTPDTSTTTMMEPVTSDGLVQKRVLQPGEGDPAGRGAKVRVKYTLRVASPSSSDANVDSNADNTDTTFNVVVDTNDNLTFTQGRKKVIAALDAVVPTMCVGEQCIVDAAPAYAFGRRGLKRKNIAPDSHVQLDVHLLAAEGGEEKKALSEMNSRDLYEQALMCKEAGNALFKEVKFEKAMVQYSQCIRFVNHLNFKPKQEQQRTEPKQPEEEPQQLDSPQKIVEEGETNGDSSRQDGENQHNGDGAAAQANGTVDSETTQDEAIAKPSDSASHNEDGSGVPDAQENGKMPVTQNDNSEGQGFTEATVSDEAEHQGNTMTNAATVQTSEAVAEEEIVTVDATIGGVVVDASAQQQPADGGATIETETATGATAATETETTRATESAANGELSSAEMNGKPNAEGQNEEEEEEEEDIPDDKEIKGLHVTALNNLSLCLVKMEDYKRAVESASVAIHIDPGSSKAYYYRYVSD